MSGLKEKDEWTKLMQLTKLMVLGNSMLSRCSIKTNSLSFKGQTGKIFYFIDNDCLVLSLKPRIYHFFFYLQLPGVILPDSI